MLKIKLYPRGKKHQRTFRVVVSEGRSKFNGRYIDDLGFWTPQTQTIEINKEKISEWTKKGAQLTVGVDKLLNPDKYPRPTKKSKPVSDTPSASAPDTSAAESSEGDVSA